MKKYSIKTVDGSRFDHEMQPEEKRTPIQMLNDGAKFFSLIIDGGRKYFNVQNIVSITEIDE